MSNWKEPKITINGVEVSYGMSMTIRVAMESFATSLNKEDSLGSDKLGKTIRLGYLKQIKEFRKVSGY